MKVLTGALVACAMMLGLSLAMATGASAAMNQPPEEGSGYSGAPGAANRQKVDDATLKRAAAAYVKVQDINVKARQVLSNTNDEDKKHQIIEQAESQKIAAVKGQGMQPEQYNQVIMLVQADNQLRQKFLSYVRQVKGTPSGTM